MKEIDKMIKDKISSEDFKSKVKDAIKEGLERDHYWNEDNEEVQVLHINIELSTTAVITLLEKELP